MSSAVFRDLDLGRTLIIRDALNGARNAVLLIGLSFAFDGTEDRIENGGAHAAPLSMMLRDAPATR
jgi:hypothetical protein